MNNLTKKLAIGTAIGATTLATITGTFGGNEGGLPPLYNRKVGTSYGINVGGWTEFTEGSKFYGISLSGINNNFGGTFNGINTFVAGGSGVPEDSVGTVNGIEIAFGNTPKDSNDSPQIINGLQLGMINSATAGNCVQVGIYNEISKSNDKKKRSLLLNYHFKGRSNK